MTRIAIVGATLVDGNGGEPVRDSAVLVERGEIVACGARTSVNVPADAEIIQAAGQFLTPGFIDTNVHLAPCENLEILIRYRDRSADIALETAQLLLGAGVTTVRDSYGPLVPLLATRNVINRGEAVGPRVYIAGNIVGWGGPGSTTFEVFGPSPYFFDEVPVTRRPAAYTTYLMETIQDEFTQGVGEELIAMEPNELRSVINGYLDKGIDFLKFGGTTHAGSPATILFSPRAQEAIVEEVHRRGMLVDVHSTSPEGLRISLLAGVDLVQHPEILDAAPMSDELVGLCASRGVTCSMNVAYWTGQSWQDYQKERNEREREAQTFDRVLTGLERRKRSNWRYMELWRANAQKLIAAGCTISTASDSGTLPPPGVVRPGDPIPQPPGQGTLNAIEGLVEIGLTPMQAIVAATKHGAMASHALREYGTVEVGKSADLLLLDADPLADISNIRTLSMVIARGRVIDTASLPTTPVYSARSNMGA